MPNRVDGIGPVGVEEGLANGSRAPGVPSKGRTRQMIIASRNMSDLRKGVAFPAIHSSVVEA